MMMDFEIFYVRGGQIWDTENCIDNIDVLRVTLTSDRDTYQWLESYLQATNMSWIMDWELPNPTR